MGKGPLEKSVEAYLVKCVEQDLGGMALKGDVPGRRFLDRILVLPRSLTIYCECKRPAGGRYSRHQLETVERLVKLGHYVMLVSERAGVDKFKADMQCFLENAMMYASDALASRRLLLLWSSYPQLGLFFIGPGRDFDIWSLPHE